MKRVQMNQEKTVENATFPGTCYFCGEPILWGDIIARFKVGKTPVAAHLECEAKNQDKQGE